MLLNRVRTRAHVEPVIVTGDFNAGEKNPAIATLTGQGITSGPALGRMHLVDTFRALHPDAKTVGTFNGFKGTRDGEKIDYILVSPLVKTLAAEIVYDNTNGRYPSDHFPITAIVRLPVAR
jgi:endonuclease/exonuclease/phosphatase family metal-dependent hydrolase